MIINTHSGTTLLRILLFNAVVRQNGTHLKNVAYRKFAQSVFLSMHYFQNLEIFRNQNDLKFRS